MALDLTPEQKKTGEGNFQRVVGKLADADQQAAAQGGGMNRRRFMQGLIATGAVAPVSAAAYFGYTNNSFRDRPIKAGIIGTGDEGGVLVGEHNPAFVEFIAYSDIRPSNQKRIFEDERRTKPASPRKGFKFHYGNDAPNKIRFYENYRELLANPEIELVVIALPLNLHAKAVCDALDAGKHVLCEKLMAWNIRQCKAMIRKADEKDRLLAIGHQRHYSMLYAHALEVIQSGVLGDVHHIRALWHRNNSVELPANERTPDRRYRDSWRPKIADEDRRHFANRDLRQYGFKDLNELVRWRLYRETGGGLMAELGSHQLDACSIFLGKKRPIAVSAVGGKHFYKDDREVEDHVYCTFEFPGKDYDRTRGPENNDTVVVTYSSISTNSFEPYGECVMGNKGTLIVEQEQNAYLYTSGSRSTEVSATTAGGRPALDSSGSTGPSERLAQATGQASLGLAPPSRGYREEMEHMAYCIRNRDQATGQDRQRLQPRCPGRAAMADAILALAANHAMRSHTRLVFQDRWFDGVTPDTVPDWDLPVPERLRQFDVS
jgi:predicted dehydrogenase